MLEALYLLDLKEYVLFTPVKREQNILPILNEHGWPPAPCDFRHIECLVHTSLTPIPPLEEEMIIISGSGLKGIILMSREFFKDLKIQCYKLQRVLLSEIITLHTWVLQWCFLNALLFLRVLLMCKDNVTAFMAYNWYYLAPELSFPLMKEGQGEGEEREIF